jgi:hypothetical protein
MSVSDELDCRLFIDGAGDRAALTARVRHVLDLTADGHWLSGPGLGVLVDVNDYATAADGGFLAYPLSVEWYFADEVGRAQRVEWIASVMRTVRSDGGRAVAACDYEDLLP